jgi:hypothetical protein
VAQLINLFAFGVRPGLPRADDHRRLCRHFPLSPSRLVSGMIGCQAGGAMHE